MTEVGPQNPVEEQRASPPRATQGPGRHLRTLRAEARFRNDTRNLQKRERLEYSNFLWNMMRFDMGPQVTLSALVGANQDATLDAGDDRALDASVGYYRKKAGSEKLVEVLKFFTAYLMRQARRDADSENQRFLLFKAADLARMIVQFSPMSVSSEAESLVLAIHIALGSDDSERFGAYMRSEEKIYRTMQRLEVSPNDIQVRMELAEQLVAQTCHFDALVHYRMLLRILVRRGEKVQRSRGYVISKIGEVFQDMSKLSVKEIRDGRKLKSFLDRYNRDFAESGKELPRVTVPNAGQMSRLRQALMREAARWYRQAAEFSQLDRRIRLRSATRAGECLTELKRDREALEIMESQFELWRGIPAAEPDLEDKAAYLKLMSSLALRAKRRNELGWISREAEDVSTKLSEFGKERREKELARAAILG